MHYLNILFIILALTSFSHGEVCVSSSSFGISSTNRRLEINGASISIKGANWWGTETGTNAPGGLSTTSVANILDFLKSNGFNAIRIPISLDVALNPTSRYPGNINTNINPSLQGHTSMQVLDAIFDAAATRGILILLDFHTLDGSQSSSPLWYSTACVTNQDGVCKSYTIDDHKQGWNNVISRFQSKWNFFAVDLLNELHGDARWGTGLDSNDWARAAGVVGNYIISTFPAWKGLIFVEGVEKNPQCEILGFPGCETCDNDGHWWGGNLEGVRCAGVSLSDMSRLVYSPHVYGVSVYNQPYFSNVSFPDNLGYIYDTHFAFVAAATGRAIVIGEWGGYLRDKDITIQNYQAQYFVDNKIDSTFYWAVNPNPGGDTDGLLGDDWVTPNTAKLQLLIRAHPTPSTFTQQGNQICVSGTPAGASSASSASSTSTSSASSASSASSSATSASAGSGSSSSAAGGSSVGSISASGSTVGDTSGSESSSGSAAAGSGSSSDGSNTGSGSSGSASGNTGTTDVGSEFTTTDDTSGGHVMLPCLITVLLALLASLYV